jgi:5-(hydroxymethyl)furfural/furfural oxidase
MFNLRDVTGNIDYLIVGGGSSGCVMASRLSEQAGLRVVLLEAGPVYPPQDEPASISDILARSYFNRHYMWDGLKTIVNYEPGLAKQENSIPYAHARVLGGGSAINGMHAQRGLQSDYDEWSNFGVRGWAWKDVLPYFRKLEHDTDFGGPYHGDSGPITISRVPERLRTPFERAIADDWEQRQLPLMNDLNADQAIGRYSPAFTIANGQRCSAARAYLSHSVRARPNLTVVGDVDVARLLIENGRVVGVVAGGVGTSLEIKARHVVLCAGAVATPTLLQRSGIGGARELQQLGIQPVADRRGVGENLLNHPALVLSAYLGKSGRAITRRPLCISAARYSSGYPGCPEADMISATIAMAPDATPSNPLGRRFGSLITMVHKSFSTGRVAPSRAGNPIILHRLFSDERDLSRLVTGFELIREQLTQGPGARFASNLFIAQTMGLPHDSLTTLMLNRAAGFLLDLSPQLRRIVIKRNGIPEEDIPRGGEQLREWVRKTALPSYHAAGTCRMGSDDDPMAVVTSRGSVIGVPGVSISDISIFPTLMRAGTNLPAMMAAEKISQMIIEDKPHLCR